MTGIERPAPTSASMNNLFAIELTSFGFGETVRSMAGLQMEWLSAATPWITAEEENYSDSAREIN